MTESKRRHDPDRRDRIVEACLAVIVEHGVAGTSHRRVAARADVPLGSMTYHFDGMTDLLTQAFERFTQDVSNRFEIAMQEASTPEQARAATIRLATTDLLGNRREMVLMTELYTLAARDERYRSITQAWMDRSRAALGRHFDAETVAMLDALLEGLALHRALAQDETGVADAPAAIGRIISGPVQ